MMKKNLRPPWSSYRSGLSSAIVSTSSTERPPPVADPRTITVFRADADPRSVGLSLDPSKLP